MQSFRRIVIAVLTSWWLLGAIGWGIVVWNYPVDPTLPTYAH